MPKAEHSHSEPTAGSLREISQSDPDPHGAWWAERVALEAQIDACQNDAAIDVLSDAQLALERMIATTPATTIQGALAKYRVVLHGIENGETEHDEAAQASLLATLERLAAAQDPHLGWLEEYHAAVARADAIDADEDEAGKDAAYAAAQVIENRILNTKPETAMGAAGQLMALVDSLHIGLCYGWDVTGPVLRRAAELLPVPNWRNRMPGEA